MTPTQDMLKLAERFLSSGKTQKEFCQEASIKTSTFSYWLKKIRNKNAESTFGFVEVSGRTYSGTSSELEICYPNGVRIKAPSSDLSLITKLISLQKNV